jgi:hypothetical protein
MLEVQRAAVGGLVNEFRVLKFMARRRVGALVCAAAVLSLPAILPVFAGVVDDAKQAGREIAKVPKKVGRAAKQGGRAAGQTARAGGRAVKEGAKEVGRKVTGD